MAIEWVVSKNGKRFEYDNDYASVVVYDVENGCGCYGIHTRDGLRIENDVPMTLENAKKVAILSLHKVRFGTFFEWLHGTDKSACFNLEHQFFAEVVRTSHGYEGESFNGAPNITATAYAADSRDSVISFLERCFIRTFYEKVDEIIKQNKEEEHDG